MRLTVNHDVYVLEVSVATLLELHGVGGANDENRTPALGLGERKTLAGLLDVDAQLLRNAMQLGLHPDSCDEVGGGHHDQQGDTNPHQPFAYVGDGLRHLVSILTRAVGGRPIVGGNELQQRWPSVAESRNALEVRG